MAENAAAMNAPSEIVVSEKPPVVPTGGTATTGAIQAAPAAVKRSMPMALSIGLGILFAAVVTWLASELIWFLLLIYLSFVVATILDALVQRLVKTGIRRPFAAVIIMVGLLGLLVGLVSLLTNSIYNQIASVSTNLEKAPDRINFFVNNLKQHFPALGRQMRDFDVAAELAKHLPSLEGLWLNAVLGVRGITWLVLMFFVTLYMLVDGPEHLRTMRTVLPKHMRLESTRLFEKIAQAHRGWALASLTNVLSASILTGSGLQLLGIPGAFILGFVAGLGELVPNIGPFLCAIPALAITLLVQPEMFLYVVLMFVCVQTLQGYGISPQTLRFSIKLPVLVTILSVLIFGLLFGLIGVLAAVPLVADMVVSWDFANRYLERDTTDYDDVNSGSKGKRDAVAADTRKSRKFA